MATPFKTEIENRIRLLLKASAAFADVAAFARGILYQVPIEWYPLLEIVVDDEAEQQTESGIHGYLYGGMIYISDQYPDNPVCVDREINVESQDRVAVWAQAAVLLLKAYPDLNELASSDGKEKTWRVDVSVPKYAVAPSRGRIDNLESQAAVEFKVHSMRETW